MPGWSTVWGRSAARQAGSGWNTMLHSCQGRLSRGLVVSSLETTDVEQYFSKSHKGVGSMASVGEGVGRTMAAKGSPGLGCYQVGGFSKLA